MERLFLAIITMSLIALVTAISLGPMSEPRSKGEFLRERENRASSVVNYRHSDVISHEVSKLRPVVL